MREIRDANAAGAYYGKSDGGYYLDASDLRREVGGKAASRLGITSLDPDQFKRLLQGLNPFTGDQLTAKLVDDRICGWDVTASVPKGVTVALERGDARIHDALWEAGREAMADIEAFATTRERQGGKQDTDAIREALNARKVICSEEHTLDTLTPLHWTDAEKCDLDRYDGSEVIQFHRNSGTFKAGNRIAIAEFKKGMRLVADTNYSVYRPSKLALAIGDRIRITGNGWDSTKKHRLDNGSTYTVAGFQKEGVRLTNGWVVDPQQHPHLTHGFVTTSHASQGRTVDRVLIAMGRESQRAMSAEQLYVSASRGRERATIYTDLPLQELRQAVQRADTRQSATQLIRPRRPEWWVLRRAKESWKQLRDQYDRATTRVNNRELRYGR